MIYLIDDKKQRQEGYGWNTDRINRYDGILKPIYTYENMEDDNFRRLMFEGDNNIILFHESFFMGQNRDIVDLRGKIKTALEKNKNLIVVFFSGSIKDRAIKNREVLMPVSSLYQNLDVFLQKYGSDDGRIEYLLYGKNPEIENELKKSFAVANNSLKDKEPIENTKSHVILKNISNNTPIKPFCDTNEMLISDISNDKIFHKLITGELDEKKYQNIFIPLCFGNSFVDYNGLRLATTLRCTKNKNQLSNIYLYSHIGVNNLVYNEYFDILKTKNVFLIDYRYSAFQDIKSVESELTIEDLSKEMQKLKLDPPLNYADSHSIANEWAIYQWAKAIGCDQTDELTKVFQNVQTNLYFKYLRTINPVSELDKIPLDKLQINSKVKPRVLLIDDEADKGWYEIFAYLLGDLNGIYTDYLGIDFKKLSSDEIIENSIEKIFNDDIDIVILDFRLNPSDFENKSSEQITSVKLLKKIKERNPGIQVIAFSATNKIWNLKNLESEGANGFISKGNPYKTHGQFINRSIQGFIENIQECMRLVFLKDFYNGQNEITNDLIPRRKPKNEKSLPKEFIDEALKWLNLSNDILSKGFLNEAKVVSSFIFKFSVLENISNRVIDTDNPILVGQNDKGINKYKFQFRLSEKRLRNFIEDENNKGYYRKTNRVYESSRNMPWVIKILNTIDFITDENLNEEDLTKLVKKRNDFIHANSTTGDRVSISLDDLKFLNYIITLGLKNIV